jgi:hypothetical protein
MSLGVWECTVREPGRNFGRGHSLTLRLPPPRFAAADGFNLDNMQGVAIRKSIRNITVMGIQPNDDLSTTYGSHFRMTNVVRGAVRQE